MAELKAAVTVGCDPQYMGLGPYYAIRKLLDKTGVAFDEIDVFEINEAFAAQVIERSNIYGSGLGLGHPLGASGARITTTLAHIMTKGMAKYGVASLCIGGGMGAALLLERVDKNGIIGE